MSQGLYATLLALLLAAPSNAQTAQPEPAPQPGKEADSERSGNFLPLPIFVSEPAIGEGLGAALIYFHLQDQQDEHKAATARDLSKLGERSKPPPTATGVFGFYTNNDTAAIGLGHANSFADDRFRLRAAAAEARINSTFYIGDRGVDFRMEGSALFSDLKTRIGDSRAFIGLSASYVDANNVFREELQEIDGIELDDFGFVDAGLALSLIYDTRDNTILPARGYLVEAIGWRYGGDFDYDSARLKGLWFGEIAEKTVLGLRLDVGNASGDVPFFGAPYVRLRGIPALRYQGEVAGAFETELRYRLADRWSASVFGGVGSVKVGDRQTETRDEIRTIGIGGRYLALREQDAWVGIDIARGPEDLAWYIQLGSSW